MFNTGLKYVIFACLKCNICFPQSGESNKIEKKLLPSEKYATRYPELLSVRTASVHPVWGCRLRWGPPQSWPRAPVLWASSSSLASISSFHWNFKASRGPQGLHPELHLYGFSILRQDFAKSLSYPGWPPTWELLKKIMIALPWRSCRSQLEWCKLSRRRKQEVLKTDPSLGNWGT